MSTPLGPAEAYYPALGRDGVATARAVVEHQVAPGPNAEQRRAFQELFDRTRNELVLVIGTGGMDAVCVRALTVARRREPLLARAEVDSRAIRLDRLVEVADPPVLRQSLTDLFLTIIEVISSLIGFELVRPILDRIDRRTSKELSR